MDPERINKREYMNKVIRRVDPNATVIYFPYSLLYAITWAQELAFGLMGRRPVLTRYRLTSSQKSIVYDSSRLAVKLGWSPPVRLAAALEQLVRSELAQPQNPAASAVSLAAHAATESLT